MPACRNTARIVRRRFGLTQIKAASLRRMVARRIGERKPLYPSPQGQYDENADRDVIGNDAWRTLPSRLRRLRAHQPFKLTGCKHLLICGCRLCKIAHPWPLGSNPPQQNGPLTDSKRATRPQTRPAPAPCCSTERCVFLRLRS
jgi:hypothetical protein